MRRAFKLSFRTLGKRLGKISVVMGVNILTFAAILFAFEGVIRVSFPQIQEIGTDSRLVIDPFYGTSAALRPGASGTSDGVSFRVDRYGFWAYETAPDTAKPGWLLLGDSVTMGLGVDPDSTFAGRLANASRMQAVLNSAWIGYSSADYLNIARAILTTRRDSLPFHISRVSLFWCLNDVYSRINVGGDPGQGVRVFGGSWLAYIRSHSRAYQWLKATMTDRSKTYFDHDNRFYMPGNDVLSAALLDLDSIACLCRANCIQFEVVVLPYEFQLRPTVRAETTPQDILQRSLDSLGISCINIMALHGLDLSDPKRYYRFGDGIHFGVEGHRAIYTMLRGAFH